MPLSIKLSDEEIKKLSPKEREKYMEMRRRLKSKKPSKAKRPEQFNKHRDPGADDRMKEFERSLRAAGLAKGGYVNCGASMKPTQKMSKGGYAKKK
jgi:hypothetical protein